ncbi:MAG: hypothetical protein WBQ41_10680 [Solirubrobacterales bacterium]
MSPIVIGGFAMIDAAVMVQMAYAARDLQANERDDDADADAD